MQVVIPRERSSLTASFCIQVSWFRCDSCFPIRLVKFGVLSKYRLPTLKILLFGGAHFKGELQQTLVKLLPHTDVILSYGKLSGKDLSGSQGRAITRYQRAVRFARDLITREPTGVTVFHWKIHTPCIYVYVCATRGKMVTWVFAPTVCRNDGLWWIMRPSDEIQ